MARIIETTKTRSYHNVKDIVNEFANDPYDVIKVKVNMDEWKNPLSCQSSFRQAIRRSKYNIQVFRRKDQIYLSK